MRQNRWIKIKLEKSKYSNRLKDYFSDPETNSRKYWCESKILLRRNIWKHALLCNH